MRQISVIIFGSGHSRLPASGNAFMKYKYPAVHPAPKSLLRVHFFEFVFLSSSLFFSHSFSIARQRIVSSHSSLSTVQCVLYMMDNRSDTISFLSIKLCKICRAGTQVYT